MQKSKQTSSPNPRTVAPISPLKVAAREHWLPTFLLWRRPRTFEIQPGRSWPILKGPGLPPDGLSVLFTRRVVTDGSSWWLRLFGLSTLSVEKREGKGWEIVRTFVGSALRVQELRDAVLDATQLAFDKLRNELTSLVDAFELDHRSLFLPSHYVRHSQLARLLAAHERLASEPIRTAAGVWLRHPMHAPGPNRLSLDLRIRDAYAFLDSAEKTRTRHNAVFVTTQAAAYAKYFANVETSPLTAEQIAASLHFDDANVTVAAAGSGKTSVMVSKVGYAIQSGLLQEHEIIVLAYNKAAAKELRERISNSLEQVIGRKVKVEARTFHSLGLGLWRKQQKMQGLPSRPRLIDFEKAEGVAKPTKDNGTKALKGKRLLRSVLLELAEDSSDRSFAKAVMAWADAYRFPAPELDPFDDQALKEREARYDQMCRQMARRKGAKAYEPSIPTFDPKLWVRSVEEARLCNWLFLRRVPFGYEEGAPGWLKKEINAGLPVAEHIEVYRPDFTYPNAQNGARKFFHEHFGLDRNGRAPAFMGRPYEERARHKRSVLLRALKSPTASEPSRFIETTSAQFADGTIFTQLEQALRSRGIPVGAPDTERWNAALKTFLDEDSVVDLIASFLVKFRDSGLTMEEVEARMQRLNAEDRLRATSFPRWMKPLRVRLEERMAEGTSGGQPRPLLDYSGMIGGAVAALKSWPVGTIPFKLVLVDEFQDISRLRAQLVQGLLDQHPDESMLYCVGDDWQSINRFAGSDVGIFRQVYDGLSSPQAGAPIATRSSAQSMLKKTFRCPQGIANVARWFVMKGGGNTELIDKPVSSNKAGKAGVVRVVEHGDSGDERWAALESQLDRIAQQHAGSGKATADVFILMRNKKDASLPDGVNPENIECLAEQFATRGLNLRRDSMHGSKGLGAEYVILVGMDSGYKGYPSDRWDEPLIEALLPPRRSAVDEERRLFYVALTRAKVEVTILCVGSRPSPFVHELELYPEAGVIVFDKLPGVVRYQCPKCKQSWLKRQHRPGRVECMRTPFCTFSGSDRGYTGLPPNPYRAA